MEASRRLADIKKLDPMRILCKKLDTEIYNAQKRIRERTASLVCASVCFLVLVGLFIFYRKDILREIHKKFRL